MAFEVTEGLTLFALLLKFAVFDIDWPFLDERVRRALGAFNRRTNAALWIIWLSGIFSLVASLLREEIFGLIAIHRTERGAILLLLLSWACEQL
jgi:hypothetical protein